MATISPGNTCRIEVTQARKHCSNAPGASNEKTRPKVSWAGMPLGSSKNCRNHVSLARPNAATPTQSSAPQITAAIAITTMSISLWRRLLASRGSSRVEKWPAREPSRFSAVNSATPQDNICPRIMSLSSLHA
jgi:hypothetical protein